ncbi:hypothetical protein Tco_0776250 [Tanacetum coccineum]
MLREFRLYCHAISRWVEFYYSNPARLYYGEHILSLLYHAWYLDDVLLFGDTMLLGWFRFNYGGWVRFVLHLKNVDKLKFFGQRKTLKAACQSAGLQTKLLRHTGIVSPGPIFDDALSVFNIAVMTDLISAVKEVDIVGELEADAVILLKRIRKFSMTQDIGARAAVHIFNRLSFAIAKGERIFKKMNKRQNQARDGKDKVNPKPKSAT